MKGGVTLFRDVGARARHYLERDRSTADDYYFERGDAIAEFTVSDAGGRVVVGRSLSPAEYAAWVDWTDPVTGSRMGRPRDAGRGRRGSPRFAEMVVNAPKSLSIAAALSPAVSDALDAAQRDAASEIRAWLAQHSVTRVGPRGAQEVVPVEALQTVTVVHKTSRAGDPHRHIHFQIGTRVWAAGAWRGLDTAALFAQQGAIRALGTAVIAAHPQLAAVLDANGFTLDPVTGEVIQLQPFNPVMSKRAEQVERNLAVFVDEWKAQHPGQEPGPAARARLQARAWDHQRPGKKPARLGSEEGWRRELAAAGYSPWAPRAPHRPPVAPDELSVQEIASRALDRCAAGASAWTVHTVQEHATRIITEHGVAVEPAQLRELIAAATRLALEDCFSVLPPGAVRPEHVAHLTSLHVVAAETQLRDRLAARAEGRKSSRPDAARLVRARGLDDDQARAAAAVASRAPLVVVEGAAGAGKTSMLAAAIAQAAEDGRRTRVVTPTKKAAEVAAGELGVAADSVAALVYAHGWRWNADGVWTRLAPGDADPDTARPYLGVPPAAQLARGERVVVDEAGMLDQDTALALLAVADEAGATIALVGDRAQLPAVGRGGVLDIAAQLVPGVHDLATVHRFVDPEYADLTVRMRRGDQSGPTFDRLCALGLVRVHESEDDLHAAIARDARPGEAITTATNEEARELNTSIREARVQCGAVDDTRTAFGGDGLPIGAGDVIQARRNDAALGVANRKTFTVTHVAGDGTVWAAAGRRAVHLPAEYVAEHTQLAYASTAYGTQGATVDASHTVLADSLDSAGLYVGMTRGRHANVLHVVAADLEDARAQFAAALERDRADRGLSPATAAARAAVAGLVPDRSVALVNAERARIQKLIDQSEREANRRSRAAMKTENDLQRRTLAVQADRLWKRADHARHYLGHLDSVPAAEAARLIRERAMRSSTSAHLSRDRHVAVPRADTGPRLSL